MSRKTEVTYISLVSGFLEKLHRTAWTEYLVHIIRSGNGMQLIEIEVVGLQAL